MGRGASLVSRVFEAGEDGAVEDDLEVVNFHVNCDGEIY